MSLGGFNELTHVAAEHGEHVQIWRHLAPGVRRPVVQVVGWPEISDHLNQAVAKKLFIETEINGIIHNQSSSSFC